MKEMTLKLKSYQKRLNSEIWVLWKLPKNSKTTFQIQLKMKIELANLMHGPQVAPQARHSLKNKSRGGCVPSLTGEVE